MGDPVVGTVRIEPEHLVGAIAALPDEALRPLAARLAALAGEPARPLSPWLTPDEAAEYLRTTRKAIYSRIDAGQLTRHGSPGRVLLARSELEAHALGDRENGPRRVGQLLTGPTGLIENPHGQADTRKSKK